MHRQLFQITSNAVKRCTFYYQLLPKNSLIFTRKRYIATANASFTQVACSPNTLVANEQHKALANLQGHRTQGTKKELDSLKIVQELRADSNYYENTSFTHLGGNSKAQSLTATVLRGKGKIALAPVVFFHKTNANVIAVAHLGADLCGNPDMIHGGVLATLLDEILACVAVQTLRDKIGYTANLSLDYRLPVFADQWVVVRGQAGKTEGRKAWVEAWVESADGQVRFVEAKSLYVSPKNASSNL